MIYKEVTPVNNPIEFKEINPEDFDPTCYQVSPKINLSLSEEGFITDSLLQNIVIEDCNTVVVNAGVGQGKTEAIIEVIKQFYQSKNEDGSHRYVVVIAAPFKALIDQYIKKLIHKGAPKESIFDYRLLSDKENATRLSLFTEMPLQVITIKSLIGDYGSHALQQSSLKRKYIRRLIKHCEETNKKVVFIFDEVHESISSFKEKEVFNLWNWQHVLHKNIILSATYNEASKVVIGYLAELTNDKIQILESPRTVFPSKQSNLTLCYINDNSITGNSSSFIHLIRQQCLLNKRINILSFSRLLAEDIYFEKKLPNGKKVKSGVRQTLEDYSYGVNLCVGGTGNFEFDRVVCNIGTTFKTGISIEDSNAALFIVLPSKASYERMPRSFGIFSDGLNSVIQALARLRVKGEIFVVTPTPKLLIKNNPQHPNYESAYKEIVHLKKLKQEHDYHSFNEQNDLIKAFYDGLLTQLEKAKENLNWKYSGLVEENREEQRPRLAFPPLLNYILNDGSHYFNFKHAIFGADPSAYVTWAAFNNQFINCKLVAVYEEGSINFTKGKIQAQLGKFYDDKFSNYRLPQSDLEFYEEFRSKLFSYKIFLDKEAVYPYLNIGFERQLISFVQRVKRESSFYKAKFYPDEKDGVLNDYDIDSNYVRACVSHAIRVDFRAQIAEAESNGNLEQWNLVKAYQALDELKTDFFVRAHNIAENGTAFFPSNKHLASDTSIMSDDFLIKAIHCANSIHSYDTIVKKKIISLFREIGNKDASKILASPPSRDKVARHIASTLKEVFYEIEPNAYVGANIFETKKHDKILGEKKLRPFQTEINLIYSPPDFDSLIEEYIQVED